jgi:hypothetical protein
MKDNVIAFLCFLIGAILILIIGQICEKNTPIKQNQINIIKINSLKK